MSSGFATDIKDRIKQANDIVDLVGSYLQLRRQGSGYVCHCPWHDDQRPSLQVNPARQSWVCWVCDIRGDVFDFVMRREGVEFVEAMRILAERAGIPLTMTQKKVVPGSVDDKQTLYRAMAWAESQFHQFLLTDPEARIARDYLAERGIDPASIREFKLGFCPPSYTWLVDRIPRNEFTPEILEAVDLIGQNNYGGWYDRFRGRLLFPIRDTMHRCIAMGGRLVPGVFSPEQEPPGKYINSRETRLFSKSETLYGLNIVRDQVAKTRSLTIVEGYTDVIAAWQAGLRDVVACLGTALNERHLKLIKRFADRITLVLDGDAAGQRRANEVLDLFVAHNIDLRIATLPDQADPFDYLMNQGAEAFTERVDQAVDAIEHKIRVETSGIDLLNDTHRANQALENILATLARVPITKLANSASLRLRQDQLLSRLSRRFQTQSELLRQRVTELRARIRGPEPSTETVEREIDFEKLNRFEVELLQLVLQDAALLDLVCENISPTQFEEGPLRELFLVVHECFHEGVDATSDDLMLRLEDVRLRSLVNHLDAQWQEKIGAAEKARIEMNPRALLDELIQRFREIEDTAGDLAEITRLRNGELNPEEETEALELLLAQARQRHGLKPPTDG